MADAGVSLPASMKTIQNWVVFPGKTSAEALSRSPFGSSSGRAGKGAAGAAKNFLIFFLQFLGGLFTLAKN